MQFCLEYQLIIVYTKEFINYIAWNYLALLILPEPGVHGV
jgi:hypothetical protein